MHFTLVLPLLKNNYARLCHCLPRDYVKTVNKLKHLTPAMPADYMEQLKKFQSTELINEVLVVNLLRNIKTDDNVFGFCDLMENLCDEMASKNVIEALRNGKWCEVIRVLNSVNSIYVKKAPLSTKITTA